MLSDVNLSTLPKCRTAWRASKETGWQKQDLNRLSGISMQKEGHFLAEALGGIRDKVPAGVVVGLAPLDDMLKEIESYQKKDIKE